jgi:hypothetical protein
MPVLVASINLYGHSKPVRRAMFTVVEYARIALRYFNAHGADPEGKSARFLTLITTALTKLHDDIHVSDIADAHVRGGESRGAQFANMRGYSIKDKRCAPPRSAPKSCDGPDPVLAQAMHLHAPPCPVIHDFDAAQSVMSATRVRA